MLLFFDGFEGLVNSYAMLSRRWTVNAANAAYISFTAAGRFGRGTYLNVGYLSNIAKTIVPATTVFVGCAILPIATFSDKTLITFVDGSTIHCGLAMRADGSLFLFKGAAYTTAVANIASGAQILRMGAWVYVEVKCTPGINTTTGVFEVKINNVTMYSGSGLNLKTGTNATISSVTFWPPGSGAVNAQGAFDDIYICDDTGATHNTFLGNIDIRNQLPTSDSAVQFTRNTGATNYSAVDDTAIPDDDTTYVESANAGDQDLYGMAAIASPTPDTILALAITFCVKNTDASVRTIANTISSNSVTADGVTTGLSASYSSIQSIFPLNPDGSVEWTPTTVNAALAGFKVVT